VNGPGLGIGPPNSGPFAYRRAIDERAATR
jgi:hypothetical protein